MSTPAQDFAEAMKLPPAEAAAALAARSSMMETWSWMDLWEEQHASQFTISRLTRADLLQAVFDGLKKSVAGDLSRTDWTRDVRGLLQQAGWWGQKTITNPDTGEIVKTNFDNARLKLIYDTNTRQSYSAGQWMRTVRNQHTEPYIRYVTMHDDRVRPLHREWDGVTLPVDDDFWNTHLPPCGWRCRCRWISVSQKEYDDGYSEWQPPYIYETDASGKMTATRPPMQRIEFKKEAPDTVMVQFLNRSTGQIVQTPAGVDPGFGYNAGKAAQQALQQLVTGKLEKLDPAIAQVAMASGLFTERTMQEWLDKPTGFVPLVSIPAKDMEKIGSKISIALLSEDTAVKQLSEHPELTAAEYLQAQTVIDNATYTVQDSPTSLVYIREIASGDAAGHVLVVKATRTGEGLFVTSFRRLSTDEARRDREIGRLLRKGKKE